MTNNKQGATTFQRLGNYDYRRELLVGEKGPGDVRRRMLGDGDPRVYLLDLHKQVRSCIRVMQPRVRKARQRRGGRTVTEEQQADAKATAVIKRRVQDGHLGGSDKAGAEASEDETRQQQTLSLTERHHLAESDALERIDETIRSGNRVRWIRSAQASPAFFDVESLPNVIQVALNTGHPVHTHLYEVLHPELDDLGEEELKARLDKVSAAFRLLIYAWARYEEEQISPERRKVRDARLEWGKYAEEFFDEDDGSLAPTDLV